MKITKIYLCVCSLLFACFLVCGSILRPVVTYASPYDLMIGSSSNALMTLELDDSDYGVMPLSSLGIVTNTIDYSGMYVRGEFLYKNDHTHAYNRYVSVDEDGYFSLDGLDGNVYIDRVVFCLGKDALPSPGTYKFSMDYSSDFWVPYNGNELRIYNYKTSKNANTLEGDFGIAFQVASGDFYLTPTSIQINNIDYFCPYVDLNANDIFHYRGYVKFNFTKTNTDPAYSTVGGTVSNDDYNFDVTDSLGDLSSSVDEVSDEIGFVAEAIQNLQGAMEPHYNNVLTQLHHITEQLHAFYDQIYNNIHLKEYALWQDIKTAIENIDLEVNVNLDKLKTSIDNMSQAIQNKLQSVQDTLTNGFDNSSINQDAAELDQSLQEYEEAEQTVIDQVNDSLNDFEFDSGFEEYTNTIKVFSDFIQDLYEASGGFKVVINLSLMLSIAGIVIGVYRFRDGG